MKKTINVFDASAEVFELASRYLPIDVVRIEFVHRKTGEKYIDVWIHLDIEDDGTNSIHVSINENEIKFGLYLILNRVEKQSVATAIKLKLYTPQLLVF